MLHDIVFYPSPRQIDFYFATHFCEVNTYDYTQAIPDRKYVDEGI